MPDQSAGGADPTEQPGDAESVSAEEQTATEQAGTEESPAEADPREQEIADLKDQVLRGQAEMENLRRRNTRDVENARKYGVEKLVADLLPVIDSYEKGLEATHDLGDDAAKAVAEGLTLAQKLFLDTLARFGLEVVDPLGEPFDPQQQEAMAMVPNPDMEPNSVMEVLQRGYVLHGRVVRAAKVVVTQSVSPEDARD